MENLRIGCGAGYQGDRIEPAKELVSKGDIEYLVYECLAERTIALSQLEKRADTNKGYDTLLEARLEEVLPLCVERGVKIITNMGAANPVAAAQVASRCAKDLGFSGIKIVSVVGDDVLDYVKSKRGIKIMETGQCVSDYEQKNLVSANAYLGIEPILAALKQDAAIVITGRVADPALFLAPMIYKFGWALDDWDKLGAGTVVGHLLECAGQVTGGYFADPTNQRKCLSAYDLATLGFPIAEVGNNGNAVITKPEGSGGIVNKMTVSEQLLYEIHNPKRYVTPDVIADFSKVKIKECGKDRVKVTGGKGRRRPEKLKVSVGILEGYRGEAQISYLGFGAINRAILAANTISLRLKQLEISPKEMRIDYVGFNSLSRAAAIEPSEVRARFAYKTETAETANAIGKEVERLYVNGPFGGGGAFISKASELIGIMSVLIPRSIPETKVHVIENG